MLAQFPVIGDQLHARALSGQVTALVLGLLTSLWAGLGITMAAQNAFDKVWAVPYKDRPGLHPLAPARPAAAHVPGCHVRRVRRRDHARDRGVRQRAAQDRRIRDHAGGQLRPVRVGLPLPHVGNRSHPLPVAGSGDRRGLPDCHAARGHGLRQARDRPRQQRLRHVRHRDRTARVAAPDRPAHALRRGDQRRRRPAAVAAQPARAARRARRSGDPANWPRSKSATTTSRSTCTSTTRRPPGLRTLRTACRAPRAGSSRAATSTVRPPPGSRRTRRAGARRSPRSRGAAPRRRAR